MHNCIDNSFRVEIDLSGNTANVCRSVEKEDGRVKNKKKLMVLSTLGVFALLLLVLVSFAYLFQSISMINIFFKEPKTLANYNDPPKNTKTQLDPRISNNDSQVFLAEEENDKTLTVTVL